MIYNKFIYYIIYFNLFIYPNPFIYYLFTHLSIIIFYLFIYFLFVYLLCCADPFVVIPLDGKRRRGLFSEGLWHSPGCKPFADPGGNGNGIPCGPAPSWTDILVVGGCFSKGDNDPTPPLPSPLKLFAVDGEQGPPGNRRGVATWIHFLAVGAMSSKESPEEVCLGRYSPGGGYNGGWHTEARCTESCFD